MEHKCRNPNIGFVTKCEVQGPMRPIMVALSQMGESATMIMEKN
jgi:hypothetical protein